jgi:hypothetical protein
MVETSLPELTRRITQTRPIDRARKLALARELKTLRQRMLPEAARDAVDRMDASVLLMGFLAHADDATPEGLAIVARLLASVDAGLFAEPPVAPIPPPVPVRRGGDITRHGDLMLTSSCLLGELLVHQGIVTLDQLDEALRAQSVWRLPIGTCLERLGHATPAQIQRALET